MNYLISFCRTEYDHGVSTYSPEGRRFQVEYAIESIKVVIRYAIHINSWAQLQSVSRRLRELYLL